MTLSRPSGSGGWPWANISSNWSRSRSFSGSFRAGSGASPGRDVREMPERNLEGEGYPVEAVE